jgi:pseudouridine kinase
MQELTQNEQALLELLRKNPFEAQNELAANLGVARSTVAAQLTDLISRGHILGRGYILPEANEVVCIGGAAINRKYHARNPLIDATSNPSSSHRNFGGVARNVAENLVLLKAKVKLISMLGDDEAGHAISQYMVGLGVDLSQTITSRDVVTAEYVAIMDATNELHIGMAAMDAFDKITPRILDGAWPHIASSSWVFADCNLPTETIHALLDRKNSARFALAVDTVSIPKAKRLPDDLSSIDILFTNVPEAQAILGVDDNAPEHLSEKLKERGVKSVILTVGANGHFVDTAKGLFHTTSIRTTPADVTGAGDALISGTIHGLMNGHPIEEASRIGVVLSTLTIESELDVLSNLSPELLDAQQDRLKMVHTKRLSKR